MDIYFTNTLTKQKEKFKPIRKDEVLHIFMWTNSI